MDLPNSLLLYLLLLAALAIGFLLGRKDKTPKPQATVIKDYYQGLNFLLGERPELGVDRFIQAMEVNNDSIDVHLALASVLRRRGEVDKAIRLHQNLLASPLLSSTNKQLVEFELARDYHAAGLLDRAEGLLTDIVSRKDAQLKPAHSLLMDLYEQERDWQKALDLSRRLSVTDVVLKARLSHFHCEMGSALLAKGEIRAATEAAKSAISMDASNPRGHWLAAEIDHHKKNYKSTLKRLAKVVELQSDLGAEVMTLYATASESLGVDNAYSDFLMSSLNRNPDPRLLVAMMDFRKEHGLDPDLHEIVTYIEIAPGGQHLSLLLELLDAEDTAAQQRIRKLLQKLSSSTTGQQCQNCGFYTHHHLWHCPTCKHWGSFSQPTSANTASKMV